MDEEEDGLIKAGKDAGKKVARKIGKKVAKAIAKIIKKVISLFIKIFGKYLLIILLVALLVGSIWYLVVKASASLIEDSVSKSITKAINPSVAIDSNTENGEDSKNLDFSKVAVIEGSDSSGYYVKVPAEVLENIIANLEEEGMKPEDLGIKSFEDCFRKFIEAELVTQYPNLGDAKIPTDSKDIITNGCIDIVRAQVQDNNKTKKIPLKYTSFDNFNSMCDSNNIEALNYFTLDKDGNLLIASSSYTKITVTADGDTSIVDTIPENVEETQIIKQSPINYKKAINKYTTPFMFLIDILETSNGDEISSAIVDLTKETSITITIEDNMETTDSTTTTVYEQKYRDKSDENKQGNKKLKYSLIKTVEADGKTSSAVLAGYPKTVNIGNTDPKDLNCTISVNTITKTNTPNIEITNIDSWLGKLSKKYTSSIENTSTGPTTSDPIKKKEDANINNFNINTDGDVATFVNGDGEKERKKAEQDGQKQAKERRNCKC